jgi:malonate-semialdehyde dehydrogenase (acetylating)/methylmalonate-semialdehyde dehydrogenase
MNADIEMGSVTSAAHCNKIKLVIAQAIQEGAKILVGLHYLKVLGHEDGFFLGGTLFDNVQKGM